MSSFSVQDPQVLLHRAEGSDSAPLFCSHETPPGVLHPAMEAPMQGHGVVEPGPGEGHKDDQRAGAPPLREQAVRGGALQSGEENAPIRSWIVIGQEGMVLNWKRVDLDKILRRNSLLGEWWDTGTGCPVRF